jgi:cytochrome P450
MRMHTIVPMFSHRAAVEDVEVLGYKFPAGSIFSVYPVAVHTSSEYYKDPHVFNPDRWDTDKVLPFFPFGYGP